MKENKGQKIAKAWNEWKKSEEGINCLDILSLSAPKRLAQYLENRLWLAFLAGNLVFAKFTKPKKNKK